MDDEETVSALMGIALSFLGYRVTSVKDGDEVITEYKKAMTADPFDLVVLDLTMPDGMGGRACLERLRAIDPKVKAVISSYSNDLMVTDLLSTDFLDVIMKPCTIDDIETVIVKALKRNGQSEVKANGETDQNGETAEWTGLR